MRKKLFNKAMTGVLAAAMVVTLGGVGNLTPKTSAKTVEPTTAKRASYRAYLLIQSNTYLFRDNWYDSSTLDAKTGKEAENKYDPDVTRKFGINCTKIHTADAKDLPYYPVTQLGSTAKTTATEDKDKVNPGGSYTVEFEEAHITKPGKYQVSLTLPDNVSNIFRFDEAEDQINDSKKTGTPFNMLGIATDIPKSLGVTFSDIKVISDNEEKINIPEAVASKGDNDGTGNGAIKDDMKDYWMAMAVNTYDNSTNSVTKHITGFTKAPKKSLIIQFTVSGDIFDAAGGDSDSTVPYKAAVKNAQDNVPGYTGSKTNAGFDESGKEIVETNSISADGSMASTTTTQEAVQAVANTDTSNVPVGPTVGTSSTVQNAKYTVLAQATNSAGGTVAYAGASGKLKKSKKITVPSTVNIDGHEYTVTQLNKNSFKAVKAKTIVIPKTVTTIYKGAFNKCTKLKTLKFGAKLETVGNKAFVGMKQKVKITGAARKANLKLVKKKGLKNAR